jgi:hypothetical protein
MTLIADENNATGELLIAKRIRCPAASLPSSNYHKRVHLRFGPPAHETSFTQSSCHKKSEIKNQKYFDLSGLLDKICANAAQRRYVEKSVSGGWLSRWSMADRLFRCGRSSKREKQ